MVKKKIVFETNVVFVYISKQPVEGSIKMVLTSATSHVSGNRVQIEMTAIRNLTRKEFAFELKEFL